MNYWEARLILSIQGNASPEEIKKAYAEKVRACNPETDPERWMRLHEAYKLLLSSAESQKKSSPPPPKPITPPLTEKRREEPDKKSGEFDEIFENLDERVGKEKKEMLDRLRPELERKIKKLLYASKLFPVTKRRLMIFMNSPEYAAACRDAELLPLLYPLFSADRNRFSTKAAIQMAEEIERMIYELPLTPEKLSKMKGFLCIFDQGSFGIRDYFFSGLFVIGTVFVGIYSSNILCLLAYIVAFPSLYISILLFLLPKKRRTEDTIKTAKIFGGLGLICTLSVLYNWGGWK